MKIEGIVTNIIYRNEDNGYNIIVVETSDSDITCVGTMPFFDEGDNVEVNGEFVYHDKYGEQINVSSIKLLKPSGRDAIVSYLANANIKGIGKKTAIQIYNEFGEDAIDIVYNEPDKLAVITGIGKKKIDDIKLTAEETRDSRNTMLYLQSLNISYNLAMKIYKFYGEDAIEIIKTNPYKLVDDISGIGFAMADNMARNMQIVSNSAFRISAGIIHTLNYESEFNGHTSLKMDYVVKKVSKLLMIDEEYVVEQIKNDSLAGKLYIVLINNEEFVYKNTLYKAEKYIAVALKQKKESEYTFDVEINEDLSVFSDEQQIAINEAFKNMLMVITGGPGTGKTTIINAIKKILTKNNLTYAMLAPTGRAAKRIQESTGDEAYTIHRLLGIKPDENIAEYNEENPIDKDYIIVDEVSMVDIYLMKSLLSAIAPTTALILVGDSNQLPSVGPGNILSDIINTGIKTIRLKKIFRQGLESNIIVNAHKINNGEYPIVNESGKDFFFIEADRNNFTNILSNLVNQRLPKFYGFDKIKDIQILCPSKKTPWGSTSINENIQSVLNPSKNEIKINDRIFKLNDKVMQIRNNYDLATENSLTNTDGVYNGDIGFINKIDKQEESLEVEFYDGSLVHYKKEDIKDLDLSYAITIHKSQGSEFDCVIIPMMQVAPMLLTRNLLYTGVTRAKKLVVLVGEKRIIKKMIDNNTSNKRYTNLSYWINEMENVDSD
ncbi:ATP-dependent RecD-like DNA helicase [Anaerococcus sp. mt242]|uniref:SF1B family DNA helicase RecD2 n=1 Tax=Anaerococcus sp. mt242 TaxID=2661917 RepID=UPI0019340EB8|nr:ATP-dependent RecD-like DNA helicase [Anaerococcus sp. mt242]MBM0045836.1 ATP-dependent RecD-like DNA helicase [Anaerococcus sp. mt242]